jgi:hypothetical protein
MMYTAFISPTHIVPENLEMPTQVDPVGDGAKAFRRRQTRGLRRWEINVPSLQDNLEQLIGFLENVQGDTPFWFDGAGMIEVTEPILIGTGDGSTTDFIFPHKYVFVSSAVIYQNSALLTAWSPLGDGIVMNGFRCTVAPPLYALLTAKYRRKAKVVLQTESTSRERVFRNQDNNSKSLYRTRFFLEEVAV